jgi:SAM-dependent methyltransferase
MGPVYAPRVRTIETVQAEIRDRSPFPADRTEVILRKRFAAVPRRLRYALERWPLDRLKVLDVGCSYGHCLVHFGPGSVGIDNVEEHVEFCRSLGLEARRVDVDGEDALADIADGAFDVLWVSDILEHLDAPRLLVRRLRPKLKPDGRLILFVTTLPRNRLFRGLLRARGIRPFEAEAHHYQYTLETIRYLVERAGYAVEEIAAPGLPRWLGAQAPRLYLAARPDGAAEAVARAAEARNKPS